MQQQIERLDARNLSVDRASKNLSSLVEQAVVKDMSYMLQGSHIKARSPTHLDKAKKSIGGGALGQTDETVSGVFKGSDEDMRGE